MCISSIFVWPHGHASHSLYYLVFVKRLSGLGVDGAAQRIAVQLPRARWNSLQKANDLAREAVGCNGGLGGSLGQRCS
jgi:hypothetical protein